MIEPTPGPLRAPRAEGYMSPNAVLSIHEPLADFIGEDRRNEIYSEAGLKFLPKPEEAIRERQVTVLHQIIRSRFPETYDEIMEVSGAAAARIVAQYRIDPKGRQMLRRLPLPLAVWMLVRTAELNAWTFCGSGRFVNLKTRRFEIIGNPAARGLQSATPACTFHTSLFRTLFRTLIDPRIDCTEDQCEACGAGSCRFTLTVPGTGET